jgi:hypothetical protein
MARKLLILIPRKRLRFIRPLKHIFSAWPKGICGGGMSEQSGKVTGEKTLMYRIGYAIISAWHSPKTF